MCELLRRTVVGTGQDAAQDTVDKAEHTVAHPAHDHVDEVCGRIHPDRVDRDACVLMIRRGDARRAEPRLQQGAVRRLVGDQMVKEDLLGAQAACHVLLFTNQA